MGIRCADYVTPLYPQKLALTSPTGGGRSVGIVRSRTKAMDLVISTNQRKLKCYLTDLCSLSSSMLHPESKSKPAGSCNLFPKSGLSISLFSPRIFSVPSGKLVMLQFLKDHNRIFIVSYNIHLRIPFSGEDF